MRRGSARRRRRSLMNGSMLESCCHSASGHCEATAPPIHRRHFASRRPCEISQLSLRPKTSWKKAIIPFVLLSLAFLPTSSSFLFGELSTLHVVGEVSRTQVKDWSLATGWNQERSARSQRSLASSLASSFEDGDLSAQSIRSSPLVQQALKLQDTASLLIRQNKTKQAYAILMEVVKLLGSKKCDEPARLLLSRVVDDIVQTLCGKAFRMPTEYDSVVDGVNALQLQLSSAQKLSVPYNGVPKQTLTRALNALTSINEINQRSESDWPTFTATKMC